MKENIQTRLTAKPKMEIETRRRVRTLSETDRGREWKVLKIVEIMDTGLTGRQKLNKAVNKRKQKYEANNQVERSWNMMFTCRREWGGIENERKLKRYNINMKAERRIKL